MIEKSTINRIKGYFFEHPTKALHLRELARQTKVSMPTIVYYINLLAKEKFLLISKDKAFTMVRANVENIPFTRQKRIHHLESLYESGLVDFLSNAFSRPQAIVCFGSYSRGEDTENSDIDIAVVKGQGKADLAKFERILGKKIHLQSVKLEEISGEFRASLINGIVLEGAL